MQLERWGHWSLQEGTPPKESGLIRFGLVLGDFSGTFPTCQKAVSEVRVSKVAGLTQQ